MKKVVFDIIRHFLKSNNNSISAVDLNWDDDIQMMFIDVVFEKAIRGRKMKGNFNKMQKRIAKYGYIIDYNC